MPRPQKQRKIAYTPSVTVFKPAGIPFRDIEEVQLSLDELEAIRLAHVEGLYQAGVSERMGISRQTAGRILDSAHQKIAHALVEGKAIRIEGESSVTPMINRNSAKHAANHYAIPCVVVLISRVSAVADVVPKYILIIDREGQGEP